MFALLPHCSTLFRWLLWILVHVLIMNLFPQKKPNHLVVFHICTTILVTGSISAQCFQIIFCNNIFLYVNRETVFRNQGSVLHFDLMSFEQIQDICKYFDIESFRPLPWPEIYQRRLYSIVGEDIYSVPPAPFRWYKAFVHTRKEKHYQWRQSYEKLRKVLFAMFSSFSISILWHF